MDSSKGHAFWETQRLSSCSSYGLFTAFLVQTQCTNQVIFTTSNGFNNTAAIQFH